MGVLGWLFGTPIGRSLLGALAILAALGAFYLWAEGKGEAKVEVKDLKATVEKQERIDDAQSNGPRTPDDVDQRLRDGKF